MSTTTADVPLDVTENRQARLATAVRGLRTRAGGTDQAKVLLVLGGVLIPLGIVLILLGWNGASGTVNLFEQIPYAISGGILGLALVFAGGFCYFAYWLSQLVYAARRDAADTHAILERIETLLAASSTSASATPTAAGDAMLTASGRRTRQITATGAPTATADYLATATGTMYHRADCPAVVGRDNLRHVTGEEPGLTPCRICNPD